MAIVSLRWQTWMARQTRLRSRASEPPLRAELFTREQQARHARVLAADHRIGAKGRSNHLLDRLDENEQIFREFNHATLAVSPSRKVTPAAEWLLDNFYLIEEQVQLARRHLPQSYSRELPRLLQGPSAGLPRVYDIVLELISHVDAQIDSGPLHAFIAAYQTVTPLKLGELWAIPIMLRLGLIENLQRITTRLVTARADRDLADMWMDRLQNMAEKSPADLIIVVADMAESDLPLTSSFVAEISQRLSRQSPVLHLARTWLEQRLAGQGQSMEQLVQQESQSQAADQVSVSHSIASLRFLSSMNWKDFVEGLSVVEQALRGDPANVYPAMDFATRDRYRHAIESLARRTTLTEAEVARQAIDLAGEVAAKNGPGDRTAHVGYYLIDRGRPRLERAIQAARSMTDLGSRMVQRWPKVFYLGGIGLITGLFTLWFYTVASPWLQPLWKMGLAASLFALCVSQVAVAAMNWSSTFLARPRVLPRLDFSSGIPSESPTMVVVPTMLVDLAGVDRLIEILEIHHLANRDARLHFALLTDFLDAALETMPADADLLERARAGVIRLNQKYSSDRFYLFHRPRRWNAAERTWMGYERKRGKLTQLNALLRGRPENNFSTVVGDPSALPSIKYVITLDTDTQLPRDAARQMVGTMSHLLNRPLFDPTRAVVVEGYAILQPRVGVSLPGSRRSWFARIYAGEAGIDPYTRAVSDVYQDVFHEGSFIGKGIYEVDAYERALEGRFPDNRVLSHDLLESAYARSGLMSDVELYEDYPSRYNVDMGRRHRWIRGDWQIAQWLFSRVPGPDTHRVTNPISVLAQWKIFDNLRRSLVPVAQLAFLLGSWSLAAPGALGPLLLLGMMAIPGFLPVATDLFRFPSDQPWLMHLRVTARGAARQFAQILLMLAFLPYDAFISVDAIGRTLWRLLLSRRRLLEWQTSSDSERTASTSLAGFFATMWFAPVAAMIGGSLLAFSSPDSLLLTLPLIGSWLAAPLIAWRISRPIVVSGLDLTDDQLGFLRQTARKTWYFFENFVNARENWLPPDNFQELPVPVVAARTSPTNIGLALLANLAARDFGYLPAGLVIDRTEATFATLRKLEQHRGHFYNWYDTRTLQPLPPKYVSSVDSGNLAGHLLTLSGGLREMIGEKIFSAQVFAGLQDTLEIVQGLAGNNPILLQLNLDLAKSPVSLRSAYALLEGVADRSAQLAASLAHAAEPARVWAQLLRQNSADQLTELLFLAPWLKTEAHRPSPADVLGEILVRLDRIPTLSELAELDRSFDSIAGQLPGEGTDGLNGAAPAAGAAGELMRCLRLAASRARERVAAIEALATESENHSLMDFRFLLDASRDLFFIGYNVTDRRMDVSYFDLLASEARLGSYVAVAQGQVPQDHWFSLGRLLVASGGEPMLVSWSGSMFEYLMPLLVMPSYENTLLDRTCRSMVRQQIAYGQIRGVPWGISESGYNRTDGQSNYQYRAFGVPGLGLKRGLADDLVIAPYATALAVMIAPREACENLQRLAAEGREGTYGFYEAIDYTPSHLPPEEKSVTIRSYMSHHQGMSLLALAYVLRDRPMQRRFMASPLLKAADLLLQERIPKTAANVFSGDLELEESRTLAVDGESVMRVISNPIPRAPEIHLLSNGRYHVVISSSGGGYSRWGDLALTRWREDATQDCWGMFVYLRDVESGEFWSATYQPTMKSPRLSEAIFTQARAEFRQQQDGLEIHTEICVSPEDNVELRRLSLTNRTNSPRVIELTSYAEVVLAPAAADAAHPAFSNLFVQTEFNPRLSAVLCTRRARSMEERPPWLAQLLVGPESVMGDVSCETDRARFVGRGGNLSRPMAMRSAHALSNTVGAVLDPIVALRRTVSLAAHATVAVELITGAAENRDEAMVLIEKYQSSRMADRAFDLAWTHNQVTLRQLDVSEAEAQAYGRLASALVYADSFRRAAPGVLGGNRRGQSGLWSYGISGDAPIVVLLLGDMRRTDLARQLLKAHAYWRMKGLIAELVILIEDLSVYRQSLHDEMTAIVASGIQAQLLDKPGGIFVRRIEQVSHDDRVLLQSAARVVMSDENGPLLEQLDRRNVREPLVPLLIPSRSEGPEKPSALAPRDLVFANGLGGFTRDGQEYVITLQPGQVTPAPWVNVLANPSFGTVVSESGSAYTWAENAHEFRLTPWYNDPVQDASGEAFYLRDEQTGEFWSPAPGPARGATPYVVRHGFGYTVFEHTERGIVSECWVYVAMDAAVKFTVIKVRNISNRPRRVSVTGYWEWVLGDLRPKNLLHVQTEMDLKTGALLARNRYNSEFPDRVVFLDVNDATRTFTGDRKEFIGRNGSLEEPAALKRVRLSGKCGVGLDPCGALQVTLDLAVGAEREVTFRLGVAGGGSEVQDLIQRYRPAGASREALDQVWDYWKRTLGAVNVDTPDPAVNFMANGWLLYQTLTCRVWGRTGFYQSGGAYGFRDQLQDVMALVHAEPAITRAHLLRAAARQFREGDVQHWWHPPAGRGVRTHFSDDYLWLPYVTCRYVGSVADLGVLDENVSFLEGRVVKPEEEAYYDLPVRTEETATLYQHCVRSIEHGLRFGEHGLPLMGCGDWNDGMNLVGRGGRGESVWLAFFLYDVLTQFSALARAHGDAAFSVRCLEQAAQLQLNIERHAWDGEWYRRAYFDNGEPLGSQLNAECQIDSLPQSWSIISGAGDPLRSRHAMNRVNERLVHRSGRLIQLFDPPFDKSDLNPGYIKGYIPGVRENGGQYTHGAIWTVTAFAMMGETDRAWELFRLLNPVNHGATAEQIATYKIEPYVVAADVYAMAPHVGRGGWSWYTGSAGWMYRLLVETLLGVNREGDQLRLTPRLPKDWPGFKVHYRFRRSVYHITITRVASDSTEAGSLSVDDTALAGSTIHLVDDEKEHFAEMKVG